MRIFLHKLGSPRYFYSYAGMVIPWLSIIVTLLFGYGLVGSLYLAPADFQQGNDFRIIYVHVPAAFLSLSIYIFMTIAAICYSIWKTKLADVMVKISAPIGVWMTLIALITGSIWGKPMWGTYWIWDARLTSELILVFIFLGIIALRSSIPDKKNAANACSLMIIVGFINIPIIHYSVYWWNTLHQGETIKLFGKSLIAPSMLYPLIIMILAFLLFYSLILLIGMRGEILEREKRTQWVQEILCKL